jgi:hypothetical protein
VVRAPSGLPLAEYEAKLGEYLRNYCHRNVAAGWRSDKRVRDTGPYIASLNEGQWTGHTFGTHAPVIVWYSPEMMAWLKANRPEGTQETAIAAAAIPDGTLIIKENVSGTRGGMCGDRFISASPDTGCGRHGARFSRRA